MFRSQPLTSTGSKEESFFMNLIIGGACTYSMGLVDIIVDLEQKGGFREGDNNGFVGTRGCG